MILEQLIFTILAFGIFVYMFFKMIRENNKAKEDAITVDCRHRCNGCGINSTDLGRGLC